MRRALMLIAVMAIVAAGCADDDAATTTTSVPPPASSPVTIGEPAPPEPTPPTTTTLATTTQPPPPTTIGEPAPTTTTTTLPETTTTTAAPAPTTTAAPIIEDASLTDRFWSVVLVDGDDVLNVRTGPGVEFPKLTSFPSAHTGIVLTGMKAQVGGSTWVEVETEDAHGWVNKFFLTEEWTTLEIDVSWNMQTPLDDFAAAVDAASDLGGPVSQHGLFVVYYDTNLRRWTQNELETVMSDGTIHSWSSPGCEPDCFDDTFADAVGLQFYDAYEDISVDAILDLDDILLGGNGPFPPAAAIPIQFKNFHWLVIYDPGDETEFEGLDWQTWFVYYDYEDGEARIVGLSPAAWSP